MVLNRTIYWGFRVGEKEIRVWIWCYKDYGLKTSPTKWNWKFLTSISLAAFSIKMVGNLRLLYPLLFIKGKVHLYTVFLYMKFNQICNFNHPLYSKLLMVVFSYMYISTLCVLYYHSHGWLHFQFLSGFKSNMVECFCPYIGFRYFVNIYISDSLNRPVSMRIFITSKNKDIK